MGSNCDAISREDELYPHFGKENGETKASEIEVPKKEQ